MPPLTESPKKHKSETDKLGIMKRTVEYKYKENDDVFSIKVERGFLNSDCKVTVKATNGKVTETTSAGCDPKDVDETVKRLANQNKSVKKTAMQKLLSNKKALTLGTLGTAAIGLGAQYALLDDPVGIGHFLRKKKKHPIDDATRPIANPEPEPAR